MSPSSRSQDSAECWNCERPLDRATEVQLKAPSGATTSFALCEDCFQTVYRPLASEAPELSVRTSQAGKVLVVDDDAGMRGLLESVLVTEGYRVNSAANGAEALAKAREDAPDAILLDMRMPVMDGHEFLRAWRQSTPPPSAPVIAISAHRLNVTAEELGVSTILPKPFEYTALLGAVAALFGASGSGSGGSAR